MCKHTFNDLFVIGAIYEKDGETPKLSSQYRVGRQGRIVNLKIDTPLFFEYSDIHGTLITSNVSNFQETDYGLLITTKNTVYRLYNLNK